MTVTEVIAIVEAIVPLVHAVAWPVTVLILAFAFRKILPILITEFARRLTGLETGNGKIKISFDKALSEAEEKARTAFAQRPKVQEKTLLADKPDNTSEMLSREVEISPRSAILKAWIELEDAIIESANSVGAILPDRRSKYKVLYDLLRRGVITEEFIKVFNQLRDIRDKVVHTTDTEIGSLDSERYIELATDFAIQIRRAGKRQPHNLPPNPEVQARSS